MPKTCRPLSPGSRAGKRAQAPPISPLRAGTIRLGRHSAWHGQALSTEMQAGGVEDGAEGLTWGAGGFGGRAEPLPAPCPPAVNQRHHRPLKLLEL